MITEKIEPTQEAASEAARQAVFAQAEFRRGTTLCRDMIKAEIVRLTDVFTREVEPLADELIAQDFASDPVRSAQALERALAALNGPVDRLVSVTPRNTPVIEQTGRDFQANLMGLRFALEQSTRLLTSSRQAERARLERAEAYRQETAEKEELHQRRLAGEDV